MKKKPVLSAVLLIAIPLAVGGLSALLTRESMADYEKLIQPPLAPPGVVFPIVWTVLFLLMGISAVLVYRADSPQRDDAFFIWGAQLFVNFWWPVFYFRLGLRLVSFFWLWLLIILVAVMLYRFRQIRPAAALLNIPYFLWLFFAAYLNLATYLLNK